MKLGRFILFISLIFVISSGYGQVNKPSSGDISKDGKVVTKYYKLFYEYFYGEDMPDHEIVKEDELLEEPSYFIAKYEKGKLLKIGYYTRTGDIPEERALTLSQYVNSDGLAYYYIIYEYNEKKQLIKKEFRDNYDKTVERYDFFYDFRDKLEKIEKWGKTPFLGKMELKGVNKFTWKKGEANQIETFTFYNKDLLPVERYYFIKNPQHPWESDQQYLVGNNKISILVISQYDRYRTGNKDKLLYFIRYERDNEKNIIQRRYNHDKVLVEKRPPLAPPEKTDVDNKQ